MAKKVFTITPEESISDAMKIMKDKEVKRLPVVKNDTLKGILSIRDIKEYTPSKATLLDVYEMHYLLTKVLVRDAMNKHVTTTAPDTPIEEAAGIMLRKDVGCLPVLDNGKLVGIISDKDIFRALVDITGIKHGGYRFYMSITDKPGSIKDVADVIRKHGFNLQSILTSYEGAASGHRNIVIRTRGPGDFKALKAELLEAYKDLRISQDK